MTRCWATPVALSALRVRSSALTSRSTSRPVTSGSMAGSGRRVVVGVSREPPRRSPSRAGAPAGFPAPVRPDGSARSLVRGDGPANRLPVPADRSPEPADLAPALADRLPDPVDRPPVPADRLPDPVDRPPVPADRRPDPAPLRGRLSRSLGRGCSGSRRARSRGSSVTGPPSSSFRCADDDARSLVHFISRCNSRQRERTE